MTTPTRIAADKLQALITLKTRQIDWLARSKKQPERADYTFKRDDNLFEPLCDDAVSELGGAQGGELKRCNAGKTPAKFHAVHSSSALAANIFEHWRKRDLSVVTKALNSRHPLVRMELEAKFPTGYGFPANLDVAFWSAQDKYVLAIESKFCEAFRASKKQSLKPAYLPAGSDSAWKKRDLIKCDRLARNVQKNPEAFEYLEVNQLLKHYPWTSSEDGSRIPTAVSLF
jgi:hypothetical protein